MLYSEQQEISFNRDIGMSLHLITVCIVLDIGPPSTGMFLDRRTT